MIHYHKIPDVHYFFLITTLRACVIELTEMIFEIIFDLGTFFQYWENTILHYFKIYSHDI